MQKLTPGRIVLYCVLEGEMRPAMVVRAWSDTCANLVVFADGANDLGCHSTPKLLSQDDGGARSLAAPLLLWKTSVLEGTGPGTWQWPQREPLVRAALTPPADPKE